MADQQVIPHAPRLLDRMRDAIRRRHYSYRTEQTYILRVKRFIYFNDERHPRELTESGRSSGGRSVAL